MILKLKSGKVETIVWLVKRFKIYEIEVDQWSLLLNE